MSPDFDHFYQTADALVIDMRAHKEVIKAANKRSENARRVALTATVAGVIGIIAAVIGIVYGINAKGTADDIVATRSENRISSCVQSNVATEKTRAALITGLQVFTSDPTRTPEQRAALQPFYDKYSVRVKKALPFRDCSGKGIDKFFESPPRDPAVIE